MKNFLILSVGILTFSAQIYAQVASDNEVIDTPAPNPSIVYPMDAYPLEAYPALMNESDVITERIYDPPVDAVRYSPDVFGEIRSGLLPGSFSQEAAWNLQNNFGFSLGVHEGYYIIGNTSEDQPSDSDDGKKSSSSTSLSANVFTNYARGKSAVHLDYGAGYRFYPERRNSTDSIDHDFNAAYMYRINSRTHFRIHDSLSTSSNDPLRDIFSINSSFGRLLAGSSYFDILFSPRRYTRNTASANFSTDVSGKGTNVSFFGTYDNYWYTKSDFETGRSNDYYSARIGAGLNQRITKWLSLGSRYSIQLNNDLRDSRVHTVEAGRFQFDLSPDINVYFSGGVTFSDTEIAGNDPETDTERKYGTRLMARAGISYTTQINRLYADYSRSMMSVNGFGFSRLLPSDTVSVGLGQPIGNRTTLRLIWYYQRSSSRRDSGNLSAYQGSASIQYIIVSGLFASGNYSYRSQKNSISSLQGISQSDRSTFSGGLVYSWPSR